jgi:hypothetical protein
MMSPPKDWKEFLSILGACDPKWLAEALFFRQQSDPILAGLCHLKVGIEKAKLGDFEALDQGLNAALSFSGSRRRGFLSDDYDLILSQSKEDLASLRDLPDYEVRIRPLLEQFVVQAANVATEFEEGYGWWSALEDLCALLGFPTPDPP